jgi:hypothetical protein
MKNSINNNIIYNVPYEFGFIFLYVAAFWISDYFVKVMKLQEFSYLLYYSIMAIIGIYLLYDSNFLDKINK